MCTEISPTTNDHNSLSIVRLYTVVHSLSFCAYISGGMTLSSHSTSSGQNAKVNKHPRLSQV